METEHHWTGKWIGRGLRDFINTYFYARKTFEISGEVISAGIRISADSRYRLWVNGQSVCRGPARYYQETMVYDPVDVVPYLRKGKNVLAVQVCSFGVSTFCYIAHNASGLLVDGVGVLKNGQEIRLDTDESWRITDADGYQRNTARTSVQTGFQENFDANKEPVGWTTVDFDDSSWRQPVIQGPVLTMPWQLMEERGIPLLREWEVPCFREVRQYTGQTYPDFEAEHNIYLCIFREERIPAEIPLFANAAGAFDRDKGGIIVRPCPVGQFNAILLDFGREVAGFPMLEINRAHSGEIFDLVYSERLNHDGDIYLVDPSRDCLVAMADRLICRPGKQVFETFQMRAFRYLLLVARNIQKPVQVNFIGLRATGYPVEERGRFECSDPLLNDIWKISSETLKLCMFDSYVDCPWREQAQWMWDALLEARANFYAFGDNLLLKRILKQSAQSQTLEGLMYGVFPSQAHNCILPDYNLVWVTALWEYYLYSGDDTPLHQHFSVMERMFAYFERLAPQGLLPGNLPGRWVFLDWAPLDKSHLSATFTMIYLEALHSAIHICETIGQQEAARKYRQRIESVEKALRQAFWSPERKIWYEAYDGETGKVTGQTSQHANAVSILLDLNSTEVTSEILKVIDRGWNRKGEVVPASIGFAQRVFAAFVKAGRGEEALAIIRREWGRIVQSGATTVPEHWETWLNGDSLCHAWSSHPIYFMGREMLGVKLAEPGWKKFTFAPQRFDLQWAKGAVPTPLGEIEVDWKIVAGRQHIWVKVPPGTRGECLLPSAKSMMLEPGEHELVEG